MQQQHDGHEKISAQSVVNGRQQRVRPPRTARAKIVPQQGYATLLASFRVPLNSIVVGVILNMGRLSELQVFLTCVT